MEDTSAPKEPAATDPALKDPAPTSWLVQVDQNGTVALPDELWDQGVLATHERFDLIVLPDGVLQLRGCSLQLEDFNTKGSGHGEDPLWSEHCICGLTKWTCAGCGVHFIVENCDDFPENWLEVSALKPDGDTIASEAVCSRECLVTFASSDKPLRPQHIPGFAPR